MLLSSLVLLLAAGVLLAFAIVFTIVTLAYISMGLALLAFLVVIASALPHRRRRRSYS